MRAVDLRTVLQHLRMQRAAQHRVAAHLVGLAEPDLFGEEVVAGGRVGVLLLRAGAVGGVRLAEVLRQAVCQVRSDLGGLRGADALAERGEELVEEESQPPEGRVVLRDLLRGWVKGDEGVDVDGDLDAEQGRVEHEDGAGRGDVVCRGEADDVVREGHADQRELGWVGEEAEDVLCVELGAVKGTGDVDPTLDLGSLVSVLAESVLILDCLTLGAKNVELMDFICATLLG